LFLKSGGGITIPKALNIGSGNVTIAGQTGPGSITLTGATLKIGGASNVIIRHFRLRGVQISGGESDGIQIYGAQNIIMDHVSASWGCDEIIPITGNCKGVTLQWSIVGEGALAGQGGCSHSEGDHNFGAMTAYGSTETTYHHTLFLHNTYRNPLLDQFEAPFAYSDLRNLVAYHVYAFIQTAGPFPRANAIGNYFKMGPYTGKVPLGGFTGGGTIFWRDFVVEELPNADPFSSSHDVFRGIGTPLRDSIPSAPVFTHTAKQAKDLVLQYAGAFPRDSVDRRFIKEFITGTGMMGKGDATLTAPGMGNPAPKDSDGDGMADIWETANGLDPSKADDTGDHDGDGYTNIEEYINDIAEMIIGKPVANPTGGVESFYTNLPVAIKKDRAGLRGKDLIKMTAQPNPFSQSIWIGKPKNFQNNVQGEIAIVNVAGKTVFSLPHFKSSFSWSGQDSRGRRVPPGIYLVHFKLKGSIKGTKKIAFVP